MSRITRNKIKLSLAVFIAVLGVAACVLSMIDGSWVTFAWFSTNRTASVDLNSIVATSLDTVESVAIYPYHVLTANEGTASDGVYTYEKTATTTDKMGKYSIFAPGDNSVLLEITLTSYAQNASSIDVTAHTDAATFLGELDAHGQLKQALALTGNSLSSIVCFYAFSASKIIDDGTYYSATLANTANSTGLKENFVSDSALLSNIAMCSLNGPVSKFYIVLDYDVALIEYIYSANIGNEVIDDVTNIVEDGQSYLSYSQDFYFNVDAASSEAFAS
jgi:hypothetical protein